VYAPEPSGTCQEPTVHDIITQCRKGDAQAFTLLVRSHQDYAFALAFRMLTDEDEAQDVVQETFIRVWKNLDQYDTAQKFTTWLYAIVSRLCLDRLRSRSRSHRLFRRSSDETTIREVHGPADPEVLYENQEIGEIVRLLSQDLSPTQRLVFTLRDLQECTIQEVCAITGLSEGSVKTNLSYARQKIRQRLARQYHITGSQS
jgi:RNA polymerase sigma-70 factor (ECF subfamily)